MAYLIEIISIGENNYQDIEKVIELLNKVQDEFIYKTPPDRLKNTGISFKLENNKTTEIFNWLINYRNDAKGERKFIICVLPGLLSSEKYTNLFGSHRAEEGLAIISLLSINKFVNSKLSFLAYYFVRYGLSFVNPKLKTHSENFGCYFDKKLNKAELKDSLMSNGFLCDSCTRDFQSYFNPEIALSFKRMAQLATDLEKDERKTLNQFKSTLHNSKSIKRFTLPHWIISLICGILFIVLYIILKSNPEWIIHATIGIGVMILVLMLNPKRRYWRAFLISISLLSSATIVPAFDIMGGVNIEGLDKTSKGFFKFICHDPPWYVYIILGTLATVALIMDYFERRNK